MLGWHGGQRVTPVSKAKTRDSWESWLTRQAVSASRDLGLNEGLCLSEKGQRESWKIPNIYLSLYMHMYECVTHTYVNMHTHMHITHRDIWKEKSKIFKLRDQRDGSVDKVFTSRKGDKAVCTGEEETEDPGSNLISELPVSKYKLEISWGRHCTYTPSLHSTHTYKHTHKAHTHTQIYRCV